MFRLNHMTLMASFAWAVLLAAALAFSVPAGSVPSSTPRLPASPRISVLAGGGEAWQVRPSSLFPGGGPGAGALIGRLSGASGDPSDAVAGAPVPIGFTSLLSLTVEVVGGAGGSSGPVPYAPAGAAEYDPARREVLLPDAVLNGLRTSRTIRISEDGTSGIWLSRFANVAPVPLTVWATLTAESDPQAPAIWTATANGDRTPDPGDEWIVAEAAGGALGIGLGGRVGRAVLADVRESPVAGSAASAGGAATVAAFAYQFRLEPGETALLLNVLSFAPEAAGAIRAVAAPLSRRRIRSLLAPEEIAALVNYDPRTSLCCGESYCEPEYPWVREPSPNETVSGAFRFRAWAFVGLATPVQIEVSGRYKGVDASGTVIVWRGPLLDKHSFSPADYFFEPVERELWAERVLTIDSASIAGGIDASRRLDAALTSACGDAYTGTTGTRVREVALWDGSPNQVHIDIHAPLDGALIDQPTTIAVQPYAPGSADVEIFADGASLLKRTVEKAAGRLAPERVYLALDPSTIKSGSRKIKAVIADAAGNRESEEITVVIPNAPPILAVEAPGEGAVVFGPTPIQFRASDDRRLERLEVFVDGISAAQKDLSGKLVEDSLTWDACGVSNGSHAIRVVLTDWDGATAERAIRVDVRNVLIDLTAIRREAQQRSLVELRFRHENPGPAVIAGFTVWRKAGGGDFVRIASIPAAFAPDGAGIWIDLPGRLEQAVYKIEAVDAAGGVIGRSRDR